MRLIARLSLTARLTLLFASASTAVLLALGWLIGASIERHFEEQDRDALAGKLMLVQHVIERIDSRQELEKLPAQLSDAIVGHHDLVLRILGPHQELLLASSGLAFPAAHLASARSGAAGTLFVWREGDSSYRGLAASFRTQVPEWQPLVVAVAVDIGHHQAFMATFMRTLWTFVACAAMATGLLGWIAASRGLAPLSAMRERAAAVTAEKLDQRLPVGAVPPELAELATTLNEMLGRLEDAFRRLSDFSSDLAHELRTPVNTLMTQTQVALSRERDAPHYREILESNAEEYERLASMISDMLFLAKAENGLALANREAVALAREVRDLFEFYEALADEKNILLQLAGTAVVQGDRLMLRRALSNLLSNALRHTPRGGEVTVQISEEPDAISLSVKNPGATIPPQHLARLFERFYRADPSRQHQGSEGTGLGLAITEAIVHAHQGSIVASSQAGINSFTIRLPRLSGGC